MRTRRSGRTAWPLAVAWAFAVALVVSLAQPSEAAAQSECAEYISGGPNNPTNGTLVGSQSVTISFGASAGLTASISATFNVGVYRMHDGDSLYVRCDEYVEWDFQ